MQNLSWPDPECQKAFAKSNVSVFIQSVQYKTDHYYVSS